MRQAKKKSDEPYIKPPDGVQIIKQSIPAHSGVAVLSKQEITEDNSNQGVTITRDLNKLKTISISAFNLDKLAISKKESNGEEGSNNSNLPADKFENDKLITAWVLYANRLQESGKESLYVTMTKRHPEIMERSLIGFMVDNKVQEQDLEKEKPELLDFLRQELNNYLLQLQVNITTEENQAQLLYTSRDKFKKMAEKNPHLLTFKQRFNLDLEF